MRRRVAMTAMAIALGTVVSGVAAHAQGGIPCDAFMKNDDGSWTALRNIAIAGAGRNFNVNQGSVFRPGAGFLGTDVAAELDQQHCPAIPPSALVPAAGPVEIAKQVDLSKYTDAKGTMDVQQLTCGQLVDGSTADTDFILLWSSGWYVGLAKKHAINVPRIKEGMRNVVAYCKVNKDKRVVQAMDSFLKDQR